MGYARRSGFLKNRMNGVDKKRRRRDIRRRKRTVKEEIRRVEVKSKRGRARTSLGGKKLQSGFGLQETQGAELKGSGERETSNPRRRGKTHVSGTRAPLQATRPGAGANLMLNTLQ